MRIPNYQFDERLYQGDATLVYAGVREADRLPVVGKLVRGGLRDLSAEFAALQKLAGPGVVEALGLFDSSDGPVLVQRRFGDGSLAQQLNSGPLSVRSALRVGLQLAQVLARVHAAGILHRDLKPANVLFDSTTYAVALADFGIAVELPISGRPLPVTDLVGTPAYVAPEQTGRTRDGCDARSDLYALGVTLYQMLTGRVPFAGDDLLDLISAHLSRLPEPPHVVAPQVPQVVSDLVMKLLSKSPEERYQSARGLAIDLTRCLETLAEDGTIPPFTLGRSDRVRPQKLSKVFGRDAENEALAAAFQRAAAGTPTACCIVGHEGAGASALLQAFLRGAGQPSHAAVGAYEASDPRPLAGISDALTSLANQLMLLEDAPLDALRARLNERLGQVGQVIVDIAPAFGDLLGAQPALAALGPAEARGRLQHAFRTLAATLGEQRVLVLALSDMDHADAASRSLVRALLDAAQGTRVLLVLMARNAAAFSGLEAHAAATMLELGPLTLPPIVAWTAALLGCDEAHAAPLATVLFEKSAGNPGAFSQLLDHLITQEVIVRSDGAFTWDLAAVRDAKAPPSLGALAAQRVGDLAPALRSLLGAIDAGAGRCDAATLAVMLAQPTAEIEHQLGALTREGLIDKTQDDVYAIAHPTIAEMVRTHVAVEERRALQGRLGRHLLRADDEAVKRQAFRIAQALSAGEVSLDDAERVRAAGVFAQAAEQATGLMAYDTAEQFFSRALALLGDDGFQSQRALVFRLEIGLARSLMMLAQHERASARLEALCQHDLTPAEIGAVYPSRSDSRSVVMDRAGAIDVGLEGLARLGYPMPPEPSQQEAIAPLIRNGGMLAKMSLDDHVNRPNATDERAIAAIKIISTLSGPVGLGGRNALYLLLLETGLELHLVHGFTRFYASFLSTHSNILHSRLGQYDAARASYEACEAVQRARPAPEIDGRTFLVLYYLIYPWFQPWRHSLEPLQKAMQFAIEAGDPLFAALSASASITLMSMCGLPFERIAKSVDDWASIVKADAGVAANASNLGNIAGKLSRGEPIEQADLDRISSVSTAAGSMRNSGMVNFGLALAVIGHEAQVRTWLEEVRVTFPKVNIAQPHLVTVWLLDGLFAAKDAQLGKVERLADAERMLANLKQLAEQAKVTQHEPAILLLEAALAEARGELDRASGLYGRAASAARTHELPNMLAYTMERRAELMTRSGQADEAALFYREAVIAYTRWGHATKVRELERALPELRVLDLARSTGVHQTLAARGVDDRTRAKRTVQQPTKGQVTQHTATHATVNESLDLTTVLRISQEISTQLQGAGVVRAVLTGIAQNAGAERVVFIMREASGEDVVYGEVQGDDYRGTPVPLAQFDALPASALRLARRTARPLIIADAMRDPAHADDPFVRAQQCRSIAVVPVRKKGDVTGYVVLENRLVAGAFTPQLLDLTQALVAQAAISLDNASLYENMEARVKERTAALNARNAEFRLVFDNVAQGLVMADRAGRLSGEHSAILAQWFPEGVPDTLSGLFASDATFGMSWEQLIDGFLPPELCLDQLPKHLRRGEQILAAGWQPILDGAGELSRMLLVLSDITEQLRRQEAELEQKQMMAIFERLSHDRHGVVEFAREAANIVRDLERGGFGDEIDKRLVHTLKGNSAFFGLSGISALCHDIESAMVNEERGLLPEERHEVCAAWRAIEQRLSRFLDVGSHHMQVPRSEFDAALRALVREGHPVAHDLELWKLESLESRFQRIGEQAQALANRLGKGPVKVVSAHNGIRINGDMWAPLWAAFVHAVRNAVDHGLETSEERAATDKGIATISLRAYFSGASLVFEFGDDGRGVAWEKVRAKALSVGLPHETHEDLVAALFSDGISTKEQADENSGRGVGMSALKDACVAMGASIDILSTRGRGTTFRFEFPAHLAKLPRERRPSLTPSMAPPN